MIFYLIYLCSSNIFLGLMFKEKEEFSKAYSYQYVKTVFTSSVVIFLKLSAMPYP